MTFSVNTADLQSVSAVFSTASTEVEHLRGILATSAISPGTQSVIGSQTAAAQYIEVHLQWLTALDQLASSLQTMSRKVGAAGSVYAQTESGNMMTSQP